MKIYKRTQIKKGFTLVELLVVIAIIASLAALATPVIFKQRKKADMAQATSNAKQVHTLLLEFDGDFGSFPSDGTADQDVDLKDYTGEYSNDYLGQLLAAGYINNEEIFYAKAGSATGVNKKPDNVFKDRTNTLETGECGFAYVKNLSGSKNSNTPVLMAPMVTKGKFDQDAYAGKAIVLRLDSAVNQRRLSKDDRVKLPSGNTLFDIGEDTVWGDEEPEIALAK